MSPVTVLTNPDGFFRERSDDPSLLPPLGVLLLVGVVAAAASVPQMQSMMSAMPAEARQFSSIAMVFGVIGGLLGVFIAWVILTVIFHVISAVAFGGEGEFTATLAVVAWGFLPGIVSNVVTAVANYYVFQTARFPSDPRQIQAFVQQLQNEPLLQMASVVGIVVLCWQAFIWTFGLRHARNLSLREAALTVAGPVGLWILWQVATLAGFSPVM